MKIKDWMMLRIYNLEDSKEKRPLRKGDKFLYGKNMTGQKENKKKGDDISYFEVIKIDGDKIEYCLKYDKLEE